MGGEDDLLEKTCCCGYMNLNKGIMFIGIFTLVEFCIALSNWRDAWFILLLKMALVILFVTAFKYFDSSKVRKVLYYAYMVCAILEVLAVLIWCIRKVKSDYAEKFCITMAGYERGKKEMEERGMTLREYLDECEYGRNFWVVALSFGLIIFSTPLKIWFTYTLLDWYKVAIEEEKIEFDEEVAMQQRYSMQ